MEKDEEREVNQYPFSFRIAEVLENLLNTKYQGRWSTLSESIKRNPYNESIEPKRLKKIVTDSVNFIDLRLSIKELQILHYFFSQNGFYFDYYEKTDDLLDHLSNEKHVAFLLAAFYIERIRQEQISRYDVKGMMELVHTSQLAGKEIDIKEIILDHEPGGDHEWMKNEEWYKEIGRKPVISIGSSPVNFASEVLLNKFLQLENCIGKTPDKNETIDYGKKPFYCYWPRGQIRSNSTFCLTASAMRKHFGAEINRNAMDLNKDRAIIVDGEFYYCPYEKGTSYNLIVAQRYKNNLSIVVFGTFALGTLAICELLSSGKVKNLIDDHQPRDPLLQISIVSTKIELHRKPNPRRDNRVLKVKDCIENQLWVYKFDQWQHFKG